MSDAAVLARPASVSNPALDLGALVEQLRAGRGLAHKRDIDAVVSTLARALPGGFDAAIAVGDDCAAIPDPAGGGHLLFAIEGFVSDFVAAEPWFAGWCGVMVNVSDIAAMGGRPVAVVDALWSRDAAHAQPLLEGLAAAAAAYGVPIVGGHSNTRSGGEHLSVAILGRAQRLLTSFDARPGDELLVAIDLRGRYHEPHPYWDAATTAPAGRLRGDIELLAQIAEAGECRCAKDISMAGTIGTALMLLECSGVGATIDVDAIPRPPGLAADALARWLMSFPSYGYVLAVAPEQVAAVQRRFAARDIACASVGRCDASRALRLRSGDDEAVFWDLARSALIGCGPSP